jgi:hypothetical protein
MASWWKLEPKRRFETKRARWLRAALARAEFERRWPALAALKRARRRTEVDGTKREE